MRPALLALLVLCAPAALAQKFPAFDTPELKRGRDVWMGTCEGCHGNPDSDAPQMLDRAAWKPRLAKGLPALYQSALGGFKSTSEMPPKGGNPSLSEADVRLAVDYMTKVATP